MFDASLTPKSAVVEDFFHRRAAKVAEVRRAMLVFEGGYGRMSLTPEEYVPLEPLWIEWLAGRLRRTPDSPFARMR